jgi:hypothetical protein
MTKFKYAVVEQLVDVWYVYFGDDVYDLSMSVHRNRSRCSSREEAIAEAFRWIKSKQGLVHEKVGKDYRLIERS